MDTFLQQVVNGLTLGCVYAVVALGYTMVYGIIQLINFAHGEIFMVGAFGGYTLYTYVLPSGTVMIHMARNAPTMKMSPWAKLMSSMIP